MSNNDETVPSDECSQQIVQNDLKNKIYLALKFVCKKDAYLLEVSAHEQSVTHRLGLYLQEQASAIDVDVEFNRHIRDPKFLNGRLVRPDILLHKRGVDSANLLVIEVKLKPKPSSWDIFKLRSFTGLTAGGYRYKHGLFIGFSWPREICLNWYKEGKFVSSELFPIPK